MPDIDTKQLGTGNWLTKYDKLKLRKMYKCGEPVVPDPEPYENELNCQTINRVDCVFPFKYKGISYDKCTAAESDSGPWCANRIDKDGAVIIGQWGDCEGTGRHLTFLK